MARKYLEDLPKNESENLNTELFLKQIGVGIEITEEPVKKQATVKKEAPVKKQEPVKKEEPAKKKKNKGKKVEEDDDMYFLDQIIKEKEAQELK